MKLTLQIRTSNGWESFDDYKAKTSLGHIATVLEYPLVRPECFRIIDEDGNVVDMKNNLNNLLDKDMRNYIFADTLNDVLELMRSKQRNPMSFDPWVAEEAGFYHKLKALYNNGLYEYVNDKLLVKIDFTDGGGSGMGGYPPSVTVSVLVNFRDLRI